MSMKNAKKKTCKIAGVLQNININNKSKKKKIEKPPATSKVIILLFFVHFLHTSLG